MEDAQARARARHLFCGALTRIFLFFHCRYDVLNRKACSRLDDLFQAIVQRLLPRYHVKLMAAGTKSNPKLLSQVEPRVEKAAALLHTHGDSAVAAVAEGADHGEYRVKSSDGSKMCARVCTVAQRVLTPCRSSSYTVLLSEAYCGCEDAAPLLCKHLHAVLMTISADEGRRWGLHATSMRLCLAADLASDAARAGRELAAAAPIPQVVPIAAVVADQVTLLRRIAEQPVSMAVRTATLQQCRYLVEAEIRRLTKRKIEPLEPGRRNRGRRRRAAAAAAGAGDDGGSDDGGSSSDDGGSSSSDDGSSSSASADSAGDDAAAAAAAALQRKRTQFRPARDTQRSKRARATIALQAADYAARAPDAESATAAGSSSAPPATRRRSAPPAARRRSAPAARHRSADAAAMPAAAATAAAAAAAAAPPQRRAARTARAARSRYDSDEYELSGDEDSDASDSSSSSE